MCLFGEAVKTCLDWKTVCRMTSDVTKIEFVIMVHLINIDQR